MEKTEAMEKVKEADKKKIPPSRIVNIVLVMIIIAGGAVMFYILSRKEETAAEQRIGMEAGIVTNEEDAGEIELNEPFSFTTLYDRGIYVTGGKKASCYIGNSSSNYYEDMYIQVYLNDENDQMAEELYVSQIIPRGSHIESFTMERKLAPGDYRGTLIYSCLDEEGALAGDNAVIVEIHVES